VKGHFNYLIIFFQNLIRYGELIIKQKGIYMSRWTDRWDLREAGLGNALMSHYVHKRFMSCITKAERGYGKSMYNLMSIAYVYYLLGHDEEESWDKALSCFIFTPEQLITRIRDAINKDYLIPFLCIDDAAVHFNNKLWFINLYTATLLEATFDTIREAVTCLLINCPSKKRLMGSLKNYDDYETTIYIAKEGGYQRKAVCINWYSLPDGHRKYRKVWDDDFSCYVPDYVYNDKYHPMRRKYLKDITDELGRLSKKHDEKKSLEKNSTNKV